MPVLKRVYEAISGRCSRCIGMGIVTPFGMWQCPECEGTGLSFKKRARMTMTHEGESPQDSIARARDGASNSRRCQCLVCGFTANLRTWALGWDCPTMGCPGKLVPDED